MNIGVAAPDWPAPVSGRVTGASAVGVGVASAGGAGVAVGRPPPPPPDVGVLVGGAGVFVG